MKALNAHYRKRFAITWVAALLLCSCTDDYKRVGAEAVKPSIPQGVVQNFTLIYTETPKVLNRSDSDTSRIIAILTSPLTEDFTHRNFKFQTFPEGLHVEVFDEDNQKSVIMADYGIVYSQTNLIDLRGNVVLTMHDGKKLESPQLFFDRTNNWVFTEAAFTYTNPEDGTIMDGQGMDFNQDFSYFKAHNTYGLMTVQENE